jgi:predicted MFS family arabinose efflux permease
VAGGIWVSAQNRMASQKAVLTLLVFMTLGSALVAFGPSLATIIIGVILVGLVIAPLATYYSLVLDQLAPPQQRPEVFALLRTANAVGVIFASAVLTAVSLSSALIVVTCAIIAMTFTVGFATVRLRSGQSFTPF